MQTILYIIFDVRRFPSSPVAFESIGRVPSRKYFASSCFALLFLYSSISPLVLLGILAFVGVAFWHGVGFCLKIKGCVTLLLCQVCTLSADLKYYQRFSKSADNIYHHVSERKDQSESEWNYSNRVSCMWVNAKTDQRFVLDRLQNNLCIHQRIWNPLI